MDARNIQGKTDWPIRRSVAEFRLCVRHDCLGAHLHHTAIRPDPYCTILSLHKPMDRNHLGQCTALCNKTGCERYWEDRTKMVGNWLCYFIITIFFFVTTDFIFTLNVSCFCFFLLLLKCIFCDYTLTLGLYIYPECFWFLFFSFASKVYFLWLHLNIRTLYLPWMFLVSVFCFCF